MVLRPSRFLTSFQAEALGEQERRCRMAQVVEADIREFGPVQSVLERPRDSRGVIGRPSIVGSAEAGSGQPRTARWAGAPTRPDARRGEDLRAGLGLRGGQEVKRGTVRVHGASNRRGRLGTARSRIDAVDRAAYRSDRGSRPAVISRTALPSSRWSTPSPSPVAAMPSPKSVASRIPAISPAGMSDRTRPSPCSAAR